MHAFHRKYKRQKVNFGSFNPVKMSEKIKITETKLLSDNWYILNKITYEIQKPDGTTETQSREVYDRGNGATILLYNKENKTVTLTRQ